MNTVKRYLPVLLACIITITTLNAEEAEKNRAGQVTFFFPMGTNGMESLEYSNAFSLNLVYGMNGGVNALEVGGVGNYNAHDVSGIQVAGVSNINMEETRGIQISGVTNTNFGDSTGLIWSGTLNSVFGNTSGVMVSSINIASGRMKGLQVGTVNYAQELEGVQFGVINVAAGGEKALPVGIFSVVKGGYFAVEASAGESLFANLSYKMGVERFYTIFRVGGSFSDPDSYSGIASVDEENCLLSPGLGWGSLIPLGGKSRLALEISASNIVGVENWDSENLNLLSKMDLNYQLGLGDHLSLFAGPSLNVYVNDLTEEEENKKLPVPYTFMDETYDDVNVCLWVGANAGLTFRF